MLFPSVSIQGFMDGLRPPVKAYENESVNDLNSPARPPSVVVHLQEIFVISRLNPLVWLKLSLRWTVRECRSADVFSLLLDFSSFLTQGPGPGTPGPGTA